MAPGVIGDKTVFLPPPALGFIPSLQLFSLPTAHTEDAKPDWILRNFLAC